MRHIFSILAALLLAPLVSLYAAELKLASVFTLSLIHI